LAFVTGSGVFALRLSSTLPPRSRFAWASTSAFAGFSLVFALSSTTSSAWLSGGRRIASGDLKCTAIATACSTIDKPSAAPSTCSLLRSVKSALRYILTSIRQAFHILGFYLEGR
jgi:hypothetical protein